MNALDLLITLGVNDEASGQIDSISSGIVGKLGKAAVKAGKALAGMWATKKVFDFGKASLDAYSSFEQMAGGVQKLYGTAGQTLDQYIESMAYTGKGIDELTEQYGKLESAQNKVFENSSKAWRTAQMSQSEYMEASTAFSGRLIRELGDSELAADRVNLAVTTLADSYNTYGTDMNLQMAAMSSIARGSYRMLDTLTNNVYSEGKESFKQFMDDARAYASQVSSMSLDEYVASMDKTGLSVEELSSRYELLSNSTDLSNDSFSDIITALSITNERTGVLGTTTKEALSTIEGSTNAAKAAWDNLVLEFAKEDADVGGRVNDLFTAIFGEVNENGEREYGVVNNVMSRISTIIENTITAIPQVVDSMLSLLPENVSSRLQGIIDTVTGIVDKIKEVVDVDAVAENFGKVGDALGAMFDSFGSTVDTGYINVLIDTLVQTVSNAWGFIEQNILPHLPELGELIGNAANFVMDFANSFLNLFNAISPIIPVIVGAVAAVKGFMFIQTLIGFFTGLGGAIAGIGTIIGTFGGVLGTVAALLGGWPVLIAAVVGAIVGFIATNEDFRNKVKEVWDKVSEAVGNAAEAIKEFVGDCADGITEGFQAALDFLSGAIDFLGGVGTAINDFMFGNLDALSNVSSSMEGLSGTTSTAMADVEDSIDKGSDSVKKFDKTKMGNKRATAAVSGNAVDGKAKDAVNKTDAAIKNLKGKDVETKAHGNAIDGSAKTKVDELRGSIDALSSKTITITTNRVENVTKNGGSGGAWGGIRLHAAGGIRIADRWGEGEPLDVVGERGPEAIVPLTSRYGGDFARMMGKEAARYIGGGNNISIFLNYHKDEDATTLVSDMANELRIQGLL